MANANIISLLQRAIQPGKGGAALRRQSMPASGPCLNVFIHMKIAVILKVSNCKVSLLAVSAENLPDQQQQSSGRTLL